MLGGVLDMEAMVHKLLILQNFRRCLSTSGTPPNGVGIYFHPAEGQEIMEGFNTIVSGLQKQGEQVTDDEAESLRAFLSSDAISPEFVRTVMREYGDASIAAAFLIQSETAPQYLEYLLRRYKGHFYRRRYPSITLVNQ
jgi:hypothetical protein